MLPFSAVTFLKGLKPSCATDWTLILLALAGWIGLAAYEFEATARLCAGGSLWRRLDVSMDALFSTGALGAFAAHWSFMTVAMMSPLLMEPVRHVARKSFQWRRTQAIAFFLSGYILVWSATGVGAALGLIVWSASAVVPDVNVTVIALVVAALWHASRWRRSALGQCHRTGPIFPFGWKADADCFLYGVRMGGACLASCWALMIVVMTAPVAWQFALTASAGLLLFVERASPDLSNRLRAAVLLRLRRSPAPACR